MIPAIPVPRLRPAVADIKARRASRKHERLLRYLPGVIEVISVYTGANNQGKTFSMMVIANTLMREFGIPVVGVGTNMEVKSRFNEGRPAGCPAYRHLTEEDFIDQLKAIEDVSERLRQIELVWMKETPDIGMDVDAESVEAEYRRMGIVLHNCHVIADEGSVLFDSYRSGDAFNIISSQFASQRRHLGVTMSFATPSIMDLPLRVRRNVIWEITPSLLNHKTKLSMFFNNIQGRSPSFNLDFDTADYTDMYNTKANPHFRVSHLDKALGSFKGKNG